MLKFKHTLIQDKCKLFGFDILTIFLSLLKPNTLNPAFTDIFTELGSSAASGFVRFLGAMIVLIIGAIVSKVVQKVILKVLKSINIDKFGDKLKEIDMFASVDFLISEVLAKLIYWVIFFIFIIAATSILQIDALSQTMVDIIGYLPRILSAAVVFLVGVFIANAIKDFITSTALAMNIGVGRIIGIIVFYFLVVMFIIVALNQAGIDTRILNENIQLILGAVLLAGALGYGLSSRDLMSNMLGSYYIKDKFKSGQKIKFSNYEGIIISKTNTSITIKKDNGNKVVIPLSKIAREEVEIIQELEA